MLVYVLHAVVYGTIAVLYLCWFELFSRIDLWHVITHLALCHIIAASLVFLFSHIDNFWVKTIAALFMPLISLALYAAARTAVDKAPFACGEETVGGWSFPTKPVVLLAMFAFCSGAVRSDLNLGERSPALIGALLVCVTLLLVSHKRMGRPELKTLYLVSLPLAVSGLLCAFFDSQATRLMGPALSNAAYVLFMIFTSTLLCSITFRYGVNSLWTFGFTEAAVMLAGFAAQLGIPAIVAGGVVTSPVIVALAIATLTWAFAIFVNDRDFRSTWGMVPVSTTSGEERGGSQLNNTFSAHDIAGETLEEQISRASYAFGLTRREEEVCVLLVRDANVALIENTLFISNSTVKTHMRHLYAKLGVHSREELKRMFVAD